MKTVLKTLALLSSLILTSLAYAVTPVAVTGNLQTALGTNLQADAKVCFRLKNYQGFTPRIIGTGVIAAPYQCALPDVSGNITTTLWGNDVITPGPDITFYSFEFWSSGKVQSFANFLVDGTTFNFNTATVVNPPPNPQAPGGGGGTPGGSTFQLQYNNAGAFAGLTLGLSGQVLTSNGLGALPTFQPSTGIPGGSSTQIQFNNSGAFGGLSNVASGSVLASRGMSSAPHRHLAGGELMTKS